jgi:hypothetical protein
VWRNSLAQLESSKVAPFFRIEIPSGSHKPYATSSGTYKIREDSRNNPLLPEALLKMFLDREGSEFRTRFSEATGSLETRMQEALAAVKTLEDAVAEKIKEIGSSLGWAEYKAGEAADTIESVESQVVTLANELMKQTRRIKAIVLKVGAKDPVKEEVEKEALEIFVKELADNPNLLKAAKAGKSLSLSLNGNSAVELEKEDLTRLFLEAVRKLSKEKTDD